MPEEHEQPGEEPVIEVTPEDIVLEEKPAPDTVPAPAPHPDTLSEAAGYPSPRRCPQE